MGSSSSKNTDSTQYDPEEVAAGISERTLRTNDLVSRLAAVNEAEDTTQKYQTQEAIINDLTQHARQLYAEGVRDENAMKLYGDMKMTPPPPSHKVMPPRGVLVVLQTQQHVPLEAHQQGTDEQGYVQWSMTRALNDPLIQLNLDETEDRSCRSCFRQGVQTVFGQTFKDAAFYLQEGYERMTAAHPPHAQMLRQRMSQAEDDMMAMAQGVSEQAASLSTKQWKQLTYSVQKITEDAIRDFKNMCSMAPRNDPEVIIAVSDEDSSSSSSSSSSDAEEDPPKARVAPKVSLTQGVRWF